MPKKSFCAVLKQQNVKQPWWKKLLSYFVEFSIEKVQSKYSGRLEVFYSRGRYALCAANAMYSYEDLYLNFRESFHQIALDKLPIQRVLLLGLGLGSVPLILEKNFQKKYHYTIVEIDEAVIRLAQKYGLPRLQSPIDLHCADAFEFVKQVHTTYDLIIVDLFIEDIVPSAFEKMEFLERIKALLNTDGLVMYNRMALSAEALEKTNLFFQECFKQAFPDANFLVIGGNRMLLSRH